MFVSSATSVFPSSSTQSEGRRAAPTFAHACALSVSCLCFSVSPSLSLSLSLYLSSFLPSLEQVQVCACRPAPGRPLPIWLRASVSLERFPPLWLAEFVEVGCCRSPFNPERYLIQASSPRPLRLSPWFLQQSPPLGCYASWLVLCRAPGAMTPSPASGALCKGPWSSVGMNRSRALSCD